jgi:transketolase
MAELVSMRKAYGEALVQVGERYPEVVAISADVSNSDFSYMFQEKFPDRFYNVGIAEQSLVDVAAGLAYSGKIPLANTFAFLFATRALEMVRTHLCYGLANVKLMGAYAGISDSFDGPTHHSICDIAIMRSLPNMTIVVPADAVAVDRLLPQIVEWQGPVFVRLNRNEVPTIFGDGYSPKIGKAVRVKSGNDLTIIACGLMLSRSLDAAETLEKLGLDVQIIEMHTIKPLDQDTIEQAARETGALVTVEEHNVIGGLGAAVCEVVADKYPVPVKMVGLPDCFAETGPYNMILDRYGMSVDHIVNAAKIAFESKRQI